MKTTNMANEIVNSGVEPLTLTYETVHFFEERKVILRSSLLVNSLDLGVLTLRQYRFVARRNKIGEMLTERHLTKLFEAFPQITSPGRRIDCITFPVYPKVFLSGKAAELLFDAFSRFPGISKSQVCVELSADLLFDDISLVKERLEELYALGVKIAFFELGDEFCPIFRLQGLKFDYAFTDDSYLEKFTDRDELYPLQGLPDFLHLYGIKVFAPVPKTQIQISFAQEAGFDGYGLAPEWELTEEEDDV